MKLQLLLLLMTVALIFKSAEGDNVYCSIAEELPRGTQVCDLAEKAGHTSGDTSRYKYQLVPRDDAFKRHFEVNENTGQLTLASTIDREGIRLCRGNPDRACRVDLAVTFLRDRDDQSTMRLLDVAVTIEDVNDNSPTFEELRVPVQARIREHDRSARVQLPRAQDPDAGKNGSVVYSFPMEKQNHADYLKFALEEDKDNGRSPVLRVVGDVDLEGDDRVGGRVELIVQASDEGSPPRVANLTVVISVDNVNDFEPVFDTGSKIHTLLVRENATVNSLIFTVRATDKDEAGGVSSLTYVIRRSEPPVPFSIDRRSGEIRLRGPLNAEDKQLYNFDVEVSDNHRPEPRTAGMTVTVKVEDVNDNAPEIRVSPASPAHGLSVMENQDSAMIAIIEVTDRDVEQQNRLLECDIGMFNQQADFLLHAESRSDQTGFLRFILKNSRPLDREVQSEHRLSLVCSDSAGLSTERQFSIAVRDVNDSPPRFHSAVSRLSFPENQPPFSVISSVLANDADEGENAQTLYEMSDECAGMLGIGQRNGSLYSRMLFDREVNGTLACIVRAHDAKRPDMMTTTTVQIEIEDLNDCRPVFRVENFTFQVPENQRPAVIGRLEATDLDSGENGRLTFSLVQPSGAFRVTSSGEIHMVGGGSRGLNREQQGFYSLRVRVQDHGRPPLSAETQVTIEVTDENDNSPRFVFPSNRNSSLNVSVHERPGAVVAKITAVDEDAGPNGQLVYELDKTEGLLACGREIFRLDPELGHLLLTQTLPESFADRKVCRLTIHASDRGAEPRRSSQSLTVRFTSARPRSLGGAGSADSVGAADGGLGGPPGRKGPRDLVVITVCVALSFLVLLCVVLMLAYFCYYLQVPTLEGGAVEAPPSTATTRAGRKADGGYGRGKLSGAGWLSCLGLGGGGSGRRLPGNDDANNAFDEHPGFPAGLAISRPMPMRLKAVETEDEDEFNAAAEPVAQFFTARRLSAAANLSGQQYPLIRQVDGGATAFGATSAPSAAALTSLYTDEEADSPVDDGRDYQTAALGGRSRGGGRYNYMSVDANYKSLRPPSTEPTQRRAFGSRYQQQTLTAAAAAAAAVDGDTTPANRVFQTTVQYLVDAPECGRPTATRLAENQKRAAAAAMSGAVAPAGYVYGSPYLTSSFV